MNPEILEKIKQEINQVLDLNLAAKATPVKKIETENLLAYWVGGTLYRIDIKYK